MDIAVSQGIESSEFIDSIDLETHIRIGKNGGAGGPAKVNYTIVVDLHAKELDPDNVMFYNVRMWRLVAHHNPDNIVLGLMPLINSDDREMLLLAFIFSCLDDVRNKHD